MVCFVRGSRSCALDRDRTAESTHHAIAVCLCLFFDLKHEMRISPLFVSNQKSQFIKLSLIAIFAPDPDINTGSEIICQITDSSNHQTVPKTKNRYFAPASV